MSSVKETPCGSGEEGRSRDRGDDVEEKTGRNSGRRTCRSTEDVCRAKGTDVSEGRES